MEVDKEVEITYKEEINGKYTNLTIVTPNAGSGFKNDVLEAIKSSKDEILAELQTIKNLLILDK